MSLRDQILAVTDLAFETVEVPEWGCTVTVREMSGTDRDVWVSMIRPDDGPEAPRRLHRPMLVIATAYGADGNRIFSESDAEALADKNPNVIDRLYETAARVNWLREKDVEAAAKNS